MNYYYSILSAIKAAVSTDDVAIAAGQVNPQWSIYHVFDGGRSFIHGLNRGRVPFVNIWRNNSDYVYDAIDTRGQGGTLTSAWTIEVVTNHAADEAASESQAYPIAQKILRKIRETYNLSQGTERILEEENHPFGRSLRIELTIINTYSNGDR